MTGYFPVMHFTYRSPCCANFDCSRVDHPLIVSVGEISATSDKNIIADFVLPSRHELNLAFQFELTLMDAGGPKRDEPYTPRAWTLQELKQIVCGWQQFKREEGFWNTYVLKPSPSR